MERKERERKKEGRGGEGRDAPQRQFLDTPMSLSVNIAGATDVAIRLLIVCNSSVVPCSQTQWDNHRR